ncbi:MAG: TonB-dependent receptor [Sphingomonas bacterium]|nr:TonB-dependent receptor [Sphingomonas bacterium]
MPLLPLFFAAAAAAPEIVVTAALSPVPVETAAASVTLFDRTRIEALGAPFALDLLRLAPGVAVASAGGPGSQAQIRIRGAEANHTLVFIDGIDFNDVAADNQARFESFATDGLDRIEVIRGAQSALWGSEALGGVIALATPDPIGAFRLTASGEYGSLGQAHGAATLVTGGDRAGLAATAAYSRSDGIDILGGGAGDRDGYSNVTTSLKGVARPGSDGEIGAVVRYVRHAAAYDGVDAAFQRADTADSAAAETVGIRSWARLGLAPDAAWSLLIDGQYLASDNRNRNAGAPVNASIGRRTRIGGGAAHRFAIGATGHSLETRIEREDERFAATDAGSDRTGDQRLSRGRTAIVGEWRASWGSAVSTDVALRHDDFNRFRDATTLRAQAVVQLTPALALVGGYGEGISQPGFAELFGFAANSGFLGNPRLTPERSRGYEAGLRYAKGIASAEIVAFSSALRDEIVYSPLPRFQYTYVNAAGTSRRRGVELSGTLRPSAALRLSFAYSWLDAREPRLAGAARAAQEVRRPRHSGSLSAEWRRGGLTAGGSIAYVGRRRDIDFDRFAAVRLNDYVLAGGRVAYAITPAVEAFGRIENALGDDYQDVVGYATRGRTFHAGLRLRLEP